VYYLTFNVVLEISCEFCRQEQMHLWLGLRSVFFSSECDVFDLCQMGLPKYAQFTRINSVLFLCCVMISVSFVNFRWQKVHLKYHIVLVFW